MNSVEKSQGGSWSVKLITSRKTFFKMSCDDEKGV